MKLEAYSALLTDLKFGMLRAKHVDRMEQNILRNG